MIKHDHPYIDEDVALGERYIKDNEGLTIGEFFDKYASPSLKAWAEEEEKREKQLRKAGYI